MFDPNCPKCGAHDYALFAATAQGCPHCLQAENAALRKAALKVEFAESIIKRVLDQGWACGGDGCSGCPACYDFGGATKENERGL